MIFLKKTLPVLIFAFFLAGVTSGLEAQEDKSKRPSPPKELVATLGEITLKINYSAPSVKGRKLWGELVPFDKLWRTGANEATTFETNQDILVQGKNLAAGKYSLFTIPNKESWMFIFNSVTDQWGGYGYDSNKDVLRVEATPTSTNEYAEMMTFSMKEVENAGNIYLWWANLKVGFSIAPATVK